MSNEKEFKPYIPADKVLPELTVVSIVLGVLLAIIFGGANAYLGLRVGMTVSASGTNLTIGTGWTISQKNRACSIYNKTTATYSLEALNVPADGTWPVYAVAGSGTENVMVQLTAAPNVYQNYENVRLLGLVTV